MNVWKMKTSRKTSLTRFPQVFIIYFFPSSDTPRALSDVTRVIWIAFLSLPTCRYARSSDNKYFMRANKRFRWRLIQGRRFRSYKTAWPSVIRRYHRYRNRHHSHFRPWISMFSQQLSLPHRHSSSVRRSHRFSQTDPIAISLRERRMTRRNETLRTKQ